MYLYHPSMVCSLARSSRECSEGELLASAPREEGVTAARPAARCAVALRRRRQRRVGVRHDGSARRQVKGTRRSSGVAGGALRSHVRVHVEEATRGATPAGCARCVLPRRQCSRAQRRASSACVRGACSVCRAGPQATCYKRHECWARKEGYRLPRRARAACRVCPQAEIAPNIIRGWIVGVAGPVLSVPLSVPARTVRASAAAPSRRVCLFHVAEVCGCEEAMNEEVLSQGATAPPATSSPRPPVAVQARPRRFARTALRHQPGSPWRVARLVRREGGPKRCSLPAMR